MGNLSTGAAILPDPGWSAVTKPKMIRVGSVSRPVGASKEVARNRILAQNPATLYGFPRPPRRTNVRRRRLRTKFDRTIRSFHGSNQAHRNRQR